MAKKLTQKIELTHSEILDLLAEQCIKLERLVRSGLLAGVSDADIRAQVSRISELGAHV